MEAQGWNTHTSCRVKPTLTDDHREARLAFCRLYLNQDWSEWIDIDEKWFYTIKAYSKRKLPPGASLPHETVKHKSHIPKVMFIAAMARPKPGQHDEGGSPGHGAGVRYALGTPAPHKRKCHQPTVTTHVRACV